MVHLNPHKSEARHNAIDKKYIHLLISLQSLLQLYYRKHKRLSMIWSQKFSAIYPSLSHKVEVILMCFRSTQISFAGNVCNLSTTSIAASPDFAPNLMQIRPTPHSLSWSFVRPNYNSTEMQLVSCTHEFIFSSLKMVLQSTILNGSRQKQKKCVKFANNIWDS